MHKFNETSLVSGYIKQLLHSFHLPKFKVYTAEQKKYFNENGEELNVIPTIYTNKKETYPVTIGTTSEYTPKQVTYVPYIKDNYYQEYVKQSDSSYKWIRCHKEIVDKDHTLHTDNDANQKHIFEYNKYDRNFTKQLQIKNNVYDSYTHEYLGDYLRFMRDYNNIDLMPLYNCFSARTCNNIRTKFNVDNVQVTIDTLDQNYKIYMLPVKLFSAYTIALECRTDVEVFCGIYGAYLDECDPAMYLLKKTHRFYNEMTFGEPQLYDALLNISKLFKEKDLSKLAQKERDLKLFIKIPASVETSITVLEGNYTTYNNFICTLDSTSGSAIIERKQNHSVTNFEYSEAVENFKPITNLQLLRQNSKESYPFADRLLEYLLGSAITHLDDNMDNVERTKSVVIKNTNPDVVLMAQDGLWQDDLKPILYNYMNSNHNTLDINHDLLGYVDRDVEKYYSHVEYEDKEKKKVKSSVSIASADIYGEEWKLC